MDRPAYVLALRLVGSPEDAEDVVQQAYLNACRSLRDGPPPDEARTWFLTVVANAAKNHLQASGRRARREAAVRTRGSGANSEANEELVAALRAALDGLEPESRALVSLCYEQGCSQREAARILDLPLSTLSDRLNRGLEGLRKALQAAGYAAAPAIMVDALKQTAPAAPASLTAFVKSLVAGGAAQAAGAATASAAGSLALGWKIAAGLLLTALLGLGGVAGWKYWHSTTAAPAIPSATNNPQPAAAPMLVTPRGADAKDAFARVEKQGGPRVVLLGRQRNLVVPTGLRFQPVEARKLIEAVAELHGLKVVWLKDGALAVLQRSAADAEVDEVLAGLKSPEAAKRWGTAWRAGWVEDLRVIEPSLAAAEGADAQVCREVLRSMSRLNLNSVAAISGERALALLEKFAGGQDKETRGRAASALGEVGGDRALALLRKLAGDPDRDVRWYAVRAIGRSGGDNALALLEKLTEDRDACYDAASALGKLGGAKALAIIERLAGGQDKEMRGKAASALGEVGGDRALAILEKLSSDQDNGVRRNAVSALGPIGGDRVLALLGKFAKDEAQDVRASAASGLGELGGAEALAILGSLAQDQAPQVRGAVAHALGKIGGEKAVGLLAKLAGDPDGDPSQTVSWSAIQALGQIGGDKALAVLEKIAADENPSAKYPAATVVLSHADAGGVRVPAILEKLADNREHQGQNLSQSQELKFAQLIEGWGDRGGDKPLALLEKFAGNQDPAVRGGAAGALGQIGGDKAWALLEKLAEDKDPYVRLAAAMALGRSGSEKGPKLLGACAGDENPGIRSFAINVLREIGGEKSRDVLLKRLAEEKDRDTLEIVSFSLRSNFPGDPVVEQALKDFKLPDPPKPEIRPRSHPQPIPAPPEVF
jgi:RNA polymerase sigma factor (sigma-70 family)